MLEKETTRLNVEINKIGLDNIQKLIDKTLAVYQADSSRVIADYRAEKQYTADYNGRQILELLQNADDAETDSIHIEINTNTKILTISNNGIPFSLDGVKSLMLANMSPKNKKEYIGNKGLGFRSVLNWVNQVEVITQNVILKFSEEFAKENYDEILKNNIDLISHVANDKNLEKGEVPFAVLAIPRVEEMQGLEKWTTSIKLHYKVEAKIEEKILTQLETIQEETLLFLKYTKSITILENKKVPKVYIKSIPNINKIQVNSKVWNIFNSGERAYDKTKMYSYQIAWQDNLEDKEGVFYTYFPTNVKTHLPCLIHATFELNASRKDINPSTENQYVLNEIAQTLGELAVIKLAVSPSNWKAYKFLNPTSSSDNKVLDSFYDKIHEFKNISAIYPSTDNQYYRKEEVYKYENDFLIWAIKNDFGAHFPKLLRPILKDDEIDDFYLYPYNRYKPEELLSITNNINPILIDLKERVKLIKLLMDASFKNLHESNISLPLLIDRKDGLPTKNQIFTIRQEEISNLNIPNHVEGMSFVLRGFFKLLEEEFSEEIVEVRKESEDVSRPLKRIIDKIVNIGSNDIIDVIRYIVGETRRYIKNETIDKEFVIKQLIISLHSIFIKNPDRRGNLPLSIPLLNRNKNLVNSDELYFGNEYQEGQLTEYIFEGIYISNSYLAGNDYWDLNFDTEQDGISFFTWLGVNKYVKLQRDIVEVTPPQEYQELVFKTRPDLKSTYHYFKGIKILEESIIEKLTIEKLLVLISKDAILKGKLEEDHKDVYKYKYGSGYPKELFGFPSFIEYQLKKSVVFSEYIIEKEIGVEHLFKTVNYQDEIFKDYSISINEIKALLEKLGAVKSLDDISLEQFYELFEGHESLFKEGIGSQGFYKKFLEFCTKNKEISESENLHDFNEFHCFARKGGKGNDYELKLVSKVFYSDNNIVPQNILDEYWIINLPKRLGEQNVKKYFGVNLLQDELKKIKINNDYNESHLHLTLSKELNKLKPYFLCYRLSSLKKKNSENEVANLIKSLEVKLVEHCTYKINNSPRIDLNENAFLAYKKRFYLKNEEAVDLEGLKKKPSFCDAIAEILSIQFKVKEHKNNFRAIFKDSISETEHLINSDDLSEYLIRAKKLLGISVEEEIFWKNYFKINNEKFPEEIQDKEALSNCLFNRLDFKLPSNYNLVDFNNLSKKETFQFLKEFCKKSSIAINELITWESKGFYKYYEYRVEELKKSLNGQFKSLLWEKFNLEKDKQKKFLDILHDFKAVVYKENIIEELKKNTLNLNWDERTYFLNFVTNEYKIDLDKNSEIRDFPNLYKNLLINKKVEEGDFTDLKLKSLLYFSNNVKPLNSYLDKIAPDSEPLKDEEEDNSKLIGKLIISDSKSLALPNFEISKGKKKGWSHSSKDISKNKKAGKKAEKIVYNSLVKEFGKENVEWLSSFSETEPDKSDEYHYDIEYKPKDEDSKYLEVKAFNGRYFHLSREEKKFADENKDKFEIALVKGKDVFILKNIFKENVDFYNNDKFKAAPSDYIIALTLENK